MKPVSSTRLERWLGAENVASLSKAHGRFYAPIALAGVPGAVYAMPDGDFAGDLRAGWEMTGFDYVEDFGRRMRRAWRQTVRKSQNTTYAGFSSLSDLISEATAGKRREFTFYTASTGAVLSASFSFWAQQGLPPPGAAGSAAPGGRAPTDATTGAFPFVNPTGGDTQHFINSSVITTVAGNNLLMYDRIFDVAKTMASTANESVTGVPTRYQSNTPGDADYAGGNFLFIETGTVLANTGHNWGVAGGSNECLYRNQAGTDNQIMPVLAGIAASAANRLDMPLSRWFAPLAAGDFGIADLAQMRCSASVATGTINFVIGHPLVWIPCPVVNMVCQTDGLNTALNLTRIFDDACIAFLEVMKVSTSATVYTGQFTTVAG